MLTPKWLASIDMAVVQEKAAKYRLTPEMVAAVVQTESAGNIYAIRAECMKTLTEGGQVLLVSRWKYFEEPDHFAEAVGSSRATEWALQLCGLGPMQVQGAVAREHGFTDWLTKLLSWDLGVEYGCKHLRLKADRYGDDPATLYAAYNGGSPRRNAAGMLLNQAHVDHFMRNYRELIP